MLNKQYLFELMILALDQQKDIQHSKSWAWSGWDWDKASCPVLENLARKVRHGYVRTLSAKQVAATFFTPKALKMLTRSSLNMYWFWDIVMEAASVQIPDIPQNMETRINAASVRHSIMDKRCWADTVVPLHKGIDELTADEAAHWQALGFILVHEHSKGVVTRIRNPIFI